MASATIATQGAESTGPPAKGTQQGVIVPVKLTFRDKEHTIEAGCTARHAIEQCGLSPEATLAVKKGQLVSDDTILQDGDEIKLVAVIAGGENSTMRSRA
jgi:sulfur carrier protein ThiS